MNTTTDEYAQIVSKIDPTRLPVHVAVIMDGNGRWAKERGLPRIAGHRAGTKAVREAVSAARELGIKVLTLYAFSVENWKRPKAEVAALMMLLRRFMRSELREMQEKGIRFNVIGRLSGLQDAVRKGIDDTKQKTAAGTEMTLNLALNYGSQAEILDACIEIAREVQDGKLQPEAITTETISKHLYTRDFPDPDLLIRTSGENRISNFLLWQIAYSELWFTDLFWPDFRKTDLARAVVDYQARARRFGGIEPVGGR